MPELSWKSKTPPTPIPAGLVVDGVLYPGGAGYPDEKPESRLIWGDNLAVMSALLEEYEGRIDLIYADPPFFTNKRYPARVGRGEDSRKPAEWQLAEGYPDSWHNLEAYLDMLYPRLALMHRLLSPVGTLYLHLDWHADAYARLLLDEIFGAERLLNEIIWVYHGPSPIRRAFNRKHDTILAYSKTDQYIFNVDQVREPYNANTVKTFAASAKAGFGKVPDLARGKVPEDWWYFPVVARLHSERSGYPTQKPEALLGRIIRVSSNPGSLVADFFCGSGTTAVAASRLGRSFLASDVTRRAIATTKKRLFVNTNKPVLVQNENRMHSIYHAGNEKIVDQGSISQSKTEQGLCFTVSDELLEQLETWEIDPNWDGKQFESAMQSVRRYQKEGFPNHINVKNEWLGNRLALRLGFSNGSEGLFPLVIN